MATPHVTGVLALVWGLHPTWSYQQVIHQVLSTVDKLPSLAGKTITGGRLDAAAAVGGAQVASAPLQITSATASGRSANTLNKVRVTFNQGVALWSFTPADVRVTGPSGQVIAISAVRVVAGTGNTTFEVTFATQAAPGGYGVRIGPEVMNSAGSVKMT